MKRMRMGRTRAGFRIFLVRARGAAPGGPGRKIPRAIPGKVGSEMVFLLGAALRATQEPPEEPRDPQEPLRGGRGGAGGERRGGAGGVAHGRNKGRGPGEGGWSTGEGARRLRAQGLNINRGLTFRTFQTCGTPCARTGLVFKLSFLGQ